MEDEQNGCTPAPQVGGETKELLPPVVQSTVSRDRLMATIVFHKDSIAAVEKVLEVLKAHPETDAAFAKTFGIKV